MAITKDQIFEVADQLDAAGQNATLAAVRKALGGGSFTTISEAMTEWKARKAAKDTPLREAPPPALSERLTELGADIWSSALERANGRLAGERESLEVARSQLEAAKAEAAELADQLSAELEVVKAALADANQAAYAAVSETAALRQALADQKLRAAISEARADEIEKRASDLNAELARVSQHNAELVAALSAAANAAKPPVAGRGKAR